MKIQNAPSHEGKHIMETTCKLSKLKEYKKTETIELVRLLHSVTQMRATNHPTGDGFLVTHFVDSPFIFSMYSWCLAYGDFTTPSQRQSIKMYVARILPTCYLVNIAYV